MAVVNPSSASPPVGAAGGDLTGTYPNPAVAKINGSPLGTTSGAATNQPLVWNGSAWVPGNPALYNDFSTGLIAPFTGGFASAAVALTASRGYVTRFIATRSLSVTKMAFELAVAAGANDNCDIGIFDSTLTTLLGSAGSTAGRLNASPGVQTVNLQASVPLVYGTVYYAAFAAGTFGGSAAQLAMTAGANGATMQLMGATAGLTQTAIQAGAFPLAAPFTIASAVGAAPILALLA